mmetsp:Transcript_100165/g.283624  ORF Transcript_100165/g.283624 Transcript_100165/m.283624 type:complete len:302 (+) Transcript_100165:120-1025(+)
MMRGMRRTRRIRTMRTKRRARRFPKPYLFVCWRTSNTSSRSAHTTTTTSKRFQNRCRAEKNESLSTPIRSSSSRRNSAVKTWLMTTKGTGRSARLLLITYSTSHPMVTELHMITKAKKISKEVLIFWAQHVNPVLPALYAMPGRSTLLVRNVLFTRTASRCAAAFHFISSKSYESQTAVSPSSSSLMGGVARRETLECRLSTCLALAEDLLTCRALTQFAMALWIISSSACAHSSSCLASNWRCAFRLLQSSTANGPEMWWKAAASPSQGSVGRSGKLTSRSIVLHRPRGLGRGLSCQTAP